MFWQSNTHYEFGPFRVDTRERRLLRESEVVPLTPKVFDVLLVLVENRGHLLTKDEVIKLVWPNTAVEEGNLARNISTLRSALGEHPRAHRYIETVPWRGYRFVAEVKEVLDQPIKRVINSIAVLPLVNLGGDANIDYLSDGLTDTLINHLSRLSQLRVMSRNATFRYKASETQASTVGRDLNVQAVITGRLTAHDDLVSVSVEIVDARDDSHLWGSQYTRTLSDLVSLQEKVICEITHMLRLNLKDSEELSGKRHSQNPEAYQLYLKGRYYFNKLTPDGVQKGTELLNKAIEFDRNYALAYVALADCHNYLAKPTEARQAMMQALALDDSIGEAHASLGFMKFIYDWDFAAAEEQFRKAVKLNPNYAEAHHWSAIYFANMGLHDDAATEAKLAVELDPLSLLMNMTPGLASYLARDYEVAAEHLLQVIEMDPNFPAAHSVLGNVYVQQGAYAEAIAEYQKVLPLTSGLRSAELAIDALIGHAYAKAGKRRNATVILKGLIKVNEETPALVSPHFIAEIHAALCQKDEAFKWLEKAYEQHDMQMVSLRVNPTLDPLRDDQRFERILQLLRL